MTGWVGASFEQRVRAEAMAWLQARTNDGSEPISAADLDDFVIDGDRFKLKDRQLGIRKPRGWQSALSITTTFRASGQERPYNDAPGPDGLLRYKWRGTDGLHHENVGLREAMLTRAPLIWFFGVGAGMFQPIFPVYLAGEEPADHQFVVALEPGQTVGLPSGPESEAVRRYRTATTRVRLHQRVFRSTIMRAYETRCAICNLGHNVLLDAAHIVPDGHPGGEPSVQNGLALCKIHHAAFDARILGIRPDHTVQIRHDLLDEIDGPMLRHGLQDLHGSRLMALPASRREHPDQDKLSWSFGEFLFAETPRVDRSESRAATIEINPSP